MLLIGGPSGTAHPSDSGAVVFCFFFFRDCCRPREPAGKCLRSSGRIHRILVRQTASTHSVVDPQCCMGREMQRSRGKLCTVPSWLRGRRTARSARKAAKRSAPSGIAAPPPKRQCPAELQATTLAHMEEFAGRLAALEVSGVAPIPTPCSSSPAMLGIPAVSRKSSSPAQHEARTLHGAAARHQLHSSPCQASSRSPTRKRCASPPTS